MKQYRSFHHLMFTFIYKQKVLNNMFRQYQNVCFFFQWWGATLTRLVGVRAGPLKPSLATTIS